MITKITFTVDRATIKHDPDILSASYDIVSSDTNDNFFRPAAALLHHMVTENNLTD